MDNRKLIVIPAVPSSGTSALAGVLYHLGIDMGFFSLEEQVGKRGYEMFEDKQIALFCSSLEERYVKMAPKLMATKCRWSHYVNSRLIETEGPQGCKLPASLMIQDDDIKKLPIIYFDVTRPLEDSIISDVRKITKRGVYEGLSIRNIQTVHMVRSADITANWWAKKEIFSLVEPELSLTFKELVTHPRKSVENIIVALQAANLGCEFLPTRKQVSS
jgi:hypothetical protein